MTCWKLFFNTSIWIICALNMLYNIYYIRLVHIMTKRTREHPSAITLKHEAFTSNRKERRRIKYSWWNVQQGPKSLPIFRQMNSHFPPNLLAAVSRICNRFWSRLPHAITLIDLSICLSGQCLCSIGLSINGDWSYWGNVYSCNVLSVLHLFDYDLLRRRRWKVCTLVWIFYKSNVKLQIHVANIKASERKQSLQILYIVYALIGVLYHTYELSLINILIF